jgi:hypothetical protein
MTPVDRLVEYIRRRYDVGQSFENLITSLKEEEKRGTQDPAHRAFIEDSIMRGNKNVCEYSGLRSISGYTKEQEDTEEYRAYRRGWLDGYDEGLYDKNVK